MLLYQAKDAAAKPHRESATDQVNNGAEKEACDGAFFVKHKPLPQDSCHFTHPKIFTLGVSKPMRLLSSGRRLNAEIKPKSSPDSRHKVQNSLSAA